MRKLFKAMQECMENKESFVLTTVIASSGSTPRGAGARMVVREDGTYVGTIGGGNVEYKAQCMAKEVIKNKQSFIQKFVLDRSQVADLGMICGGDVVVYFQYVDAQNENYRYILNLVDEFFERDEDSYLITDITDESICSMGIYSKSSGLIGMEVEDVKPLLSTRAVQVNIGNRKFYSEPLTLAGMVYVFGGGHVAQELVPVLSHLGFRCIVFDDRADFANEKVFPTAEKTIVGEFEHIADYIEIHENDYLAIMSRGHEFDYLIQKQSLTTKAHYIGVMGSQKKMEIISGKLQNDGFDAKAIERFTSPIGLAIEAETPAEIAISIAAELIALRAKRNKSK